VVGAVHEEEMVKMSGRLWLAVPVSVPATTIPYSEGCAFGNKKQHSSDMAQTWGQLLHHVIRTVHCSIHAVQPYSVLDVHGEA
jgi:hypothetical protein